MFITRKHLSRRTMLKGAGVALGLPFLEAMIPACTRRPVTSLPVPATKAFAQGATAPAAAPPVRVGFFYIPHGAVQGDTKFGPEGDRWTPSGSGADFKLKSITSPLEPFKRYVSSIGNLENAACAGSQHTVNPATWLSCTRPAGFVGTSGGRGGAPPRGAAPAPAAAAAAPATPATPFMAATLDQIIAARFHGETTLSSLEVASETTVQQASGNGAPYTTLSFRDSSTPLPMEYNPKKIFNAMFGADTVREHVVRLQESDSLLDLIKEGTQALQRDLGPGDKAVLDNYLESVRKVERQTQEREARTRNLLSLKVPARPVGVFDDFDKQVSMMFDLIALAYQADMTRVVSYIMVAEGSNQTYNHIGIPDSFHTISHHANERDKIAGLAKIQAWHMAKFAEFLKKMSETPDGDGSLLDHSIFLYGSNMGNSDKHSNWPIPTIVVGGGNGKMKLGGQHIDLPERTPLANVHLTLLNKIGIEQSKFADSTGMISAI